MNHYGDTYVRPELHRRAHELGHIYEAHAQRAHQRIQRDIHAAETLLRRLHLWPVSTAAMFRLDVQHAHTLMPHAHMSNRYTVLYALPYAVCIT